MKKVLGIRRSTAVEIIAASFVLLFAYTALSKFQEFPSFKIVLKESPLIGNMNVAVAYALPITELIISLLLFIPRTRLAGLYSSLALMTVFSLYLTYMLVFTPKLPCSCGGVLQQMTWGQHLIFNIFFTGLAGLGIWLYNRREPFTPKENQVVFT